MADGKQDDRANDNATQDKESQPGLVLHATDDHAESSGDIKNGDAASVTARHGFQGQCSREDTADKVSVGNTSMDRADSQVACPLGQLPEESYASALKRETDAVQASEPPQSAQQVSGGSQQHAAMGDKIKPCPNVKESGRIGNAKEPVDTTGSGERVPKDPGARPKKKRVQKIPQKAGPCNDEAAGSYLPSQGENIAVSKKTPTGSGKDAGAEAHSTSHMKQHGGAAKQKKKKKQKKYRKTKTTQTSSEPKDCPNGAVGFSPPQDRQPCQGNDRGAQVRILQTSDSHAGSRLDGYNNYINGTAELNVRPGLALNLDQTRQHYRATLVTHPVGGTLREMRETDNNYRHGITSLNLQQTGLQVIVIFRGGVQEVSIDLAPELGRPLQDLDATRGTEGGLNPEREEAETAELQEIRVHDNEYKKAF